MFVDEALIEVKSGDGGNGVVAFHRERFNPRGGPVGGNGGKGGDVLIEVREALSTLLDFKYRSKFEAERGAHGGGNRKTGRAGKDCVIPVPPGTVIRDADTGAVLADLSRAGMSALVARGGKGGRGNMAFASATHQVPRLALRGYPGQRRRLKLELKLLADVGVIGFPNVGKSTLIAAVSAARPKIADYPFTTLVPNLGVVRYGEHQSFVMADMPGLVVGAHAGAGLGHQFLRHVERTRLLLHLVDAAGLEGRDPLEDFEAVNQELRLYDERLATLPQIAGLNKVDLVSDPAAIEECREALTSRGHEVFAISAATRQGLEALVERLGQRLAELGGSAQQCGAQGTLERIDATAQPRPLRVERRGEGTFEVFGTRAEEEVAVADLESREGLMYLHRQLGRLGVLRELRRAGAQAGDTVIVGEVELEYVDALDPEL